jgi:hypothetical protein
MFFNQQQIEYSVLRDQLCAEPFSVLKIKSMTIDMINKILESLE